MRSKTDAKSYAIGPGPRYNIRSLTKSGPDKSPAYTIRGRETWKCKEKIVFCLLQNEQKNNIQFCILVVHDFAPGPGAYSPELCPPMNHNRRAPAYSITSRGRTKLPDEGPGPNSYLLPTCIGPKVPDKPAKGAFSM